MFGGLHYGKSHGGQGGGNAGHYPHRTGDGFATPFGYFSIPSTLCVIQIDVTSFRKQTPAGVIPINYLINSYAF